MNSPSVAVVIPFHNGSAWIERAIESAVNQTKPPAEILIVDDGSLPAQATVLLNLKERYSFQIYTQENLGQSAARNFGVSKANSDYICLLDQDDYFLPDHISDLLDEVDLSDKMFAYSYGDLNRVSESGEILASTCVNVNSQHPYTELQTMLRHNMYILPSATLIRRSAFLAVGGFDETLQGYEDDDLFLRFYLSGYTCRFVPKAVSAWTVNLSSTSFTEAMSRSRFLYMKKLFRLFPQERMGTREVFGRFIFPRFAYKIAEDVIESALSEFEFFKERVERLKHVRGLALRSKGIGLNTLLPYLLLTAPLVYLCPRLLRQLLRSLLKAGPSLRLLKIELLGEFIDRHSLPKKLIL